MMDHGRSAPLPLAAEGRPLCWMRGAFLEEDGRPHVVALSVVF
jgi:hypothetical protein